MAEPLSPADRSALAAEQGPVNMAVGGVLVFDAGEGVTRDAIAQRIAARIHLVPRLRQRIQSPALGLANPVWVDDHDFDLDWHVRTAALPAPGNDDELAALVGREMSRRLDRSRPLWELTVINGLAQRRVGVLMKIHHALVDGVAAIALGAVLLDAQREPVEIPPPEDAWQPEPFALRGYFARLATTPVSRAQRLMFEAVTRALDPDPRRAASELRRGTELLTELARTRPDAPMTPLNEPISAHRRFALARAELATIKAAARSAGGTVNDVLLATVAAMLDRYLAEAGTSAGQREPVALVPVSVRRDDEQGELGNRISTVLVDLPFGEPDPRTRIAAVTERMSELKASAAVRAGALMVGAAGAAPPLVSAMLARALGGVRAFNLVVSNIPGPQQPLYLNRARVRAVYPAVPLNPANQGLTVGIISYDGGVFFGLLASRDLDPPLPVAAKALRAAIGELEQGIG
jgi:diacylglycerol O-acyltransferase / wax synthase